MILRRDEQQHRRDALDPQGQGKRHQEADEDQQVRQAEYEVENDGSPTMPSPTRATGRSRYLKPTGAANVVDEMPVVQILGKSAVLTGVRLYVTPLIHALRCPGSTSGTGADSSLGAAQFDPYSDDEPTWTKARKPSRSLETSSK